jgi:hypothetical protein
MSLFLPYQNHSFLPSPTSIRLSYINLERQGKIKPSDTPRIDTGQYQRANTDPGFEIFPEKHGSCFP